MSDMRKKRVRPTGVPIGVFVADLHLSDKAPARLMLDPKADWVSTQMETVKAINDVAKKLDVPVFCAGDLFDRSQVSSQLIMAFVREVQSFGLKWFVIPGNHDLYLHNLFHMDRSSIELLSLVPEIFLAQTKTDVAEEDTAIFMAPFGEDWDRPVNPMAYNVFMGHKLIWSKAPFPGAPESGNIHRIVAEHEGFNALVYGDNHSPFEQYVDDVLVVNCGAAIRRSVTDLNHEPRAVVLYEDDGHISFASHTLSSKDWQFMEIEEVAGERMDTGWMDRLRGGSVSFDFDARFNQLVARLPRPVGKLLIEAMEEVG